MSYLFKYYSKQYDGFMRLFKLDKNSFIFNSLGDIVSKSIVDIGGGTGVLADMLIKANAFATIVDPEVRMTDIAKERNSNIKILNEYSNNISLKDGSVDMIIMRDAFHHISNKDETLKECRRILKENGKLIIYDFHKNSFVARCISLFERSCFEKITMLSKEDTKSLCDKYFHNGEIIDISSYEFIYIGIRD